ncbi:MAG: F0F1 ATP synthase subunit epsilon [Bacteroidales bacterium]|jgi:F-type H+-transporting ATPase subunit epsilon|nr:F0F1 ATP synthase subunit epsilon [Bacteroidales bacterium]
MKVEIITPEKIIYSRECYAVQARSNDGLFEVMDNHAPMLAAIDGGKIKILEQKDTTPKFFNASKGILEVKDNLVKILLVESTEN